MSYGKLEATELTNADLTDTMLIKKANLVAIFRGANAKTFILQQLRNEAGKDQQAVKKTRE